MAMLVDASSPASRPARLASLARGRAPGRSSNVRATVRDSVAGAALRTTATSRLNAAAVFMPRPIMVHSGPFGLELQGTGLTSANRRLLTLPSGSRLGQYEIIDAIGAGGMGEVYRARDMRLDRLVALK